MKNQACRERLMELVSLICENQEKILSVIGPPKSSLQSQAAKLEALKTPIFFVWEMLRYGDFPQSRTQRVWLSSFKTSPLDFLSECIMQIKNGDIPIDDLEARRALIDFYSELTNSYES